MKLAKAVRDTARHVSDVVGTGRTLSGRLIRDVLSVSRDVARAWIRDAYLLGYEDGVKDALTAARELEPGRVHSPMPAILNAWAKRIAVAARERVGAEDRERGAPRGNADPIGLHSMVEGNRDDDRC